MLDVDPFQKYISILNDTEDADIYLDTIQKIRKQFVLEILKIIISDINLYTKQIPCKEHIWIQCKHIEKKMYNRSKLSELYTIVDTPGIDSVNKDQQDIMVSLNKSQNDKQSQAIDSSSNKKVVIMHKDRLKDPDVLNYINPDLIKDLANEYTRKLKETIDVRDLN